MKSARLRLAVAAICLVVSQWACASTISGVDWSRPWEQPQDTRAAATFSDEYAWRLFVSLNWPADERARVADPAQPFGAARPVVWESWRNSKDVYREDGEDPGTWDATPVWDGGIGSARFETMSLKQFKRPMHIVNGVMVPLADPIEAAKQLTEIRLNRQTFDYVRDRELYNVEGQVRIFEGGATVSFPMGSREVKARWRPITEADRARYHTLRVTLADGSTRLYGLSALHIMSKDLPTWFWATFEHVDNAARSDGWELKSVDSFSCRGARADCSGTPPGIGLEGTVWQNYRLRGTMTGFVDLGGAPRLLANSDLESGFQGSSSCITCHARASIGVVEGRPGRLGVFISDTGDSTALPPGGRRGYVGLPQAAWFRHYASLDFVWSLSKAQPRHSLEHVQ